MDQKPRARPLTADELQAAFQRALGDPSGPAVPPVPTAPSRAGPIDFNALMGLDDRRFVEQAYLKLLRRGADEVGLRHYLGRLAGGASRVMVLGELRYGAEGRAMATRVPGLRLRFLLHRLYGVKVLGHALRMLSAAVALPGLMRDVARLWVEVNALRAQTDRDIGATVRETRSGADFAAAGMAREAQARAELAERLEQRHLELANRLARLELPPPAPEEPWADSLLALADRQDAQSARVEKLERALQDAARHLRVAAALHETQAVARAKLEALIGEQSAARAEKLEALFGEWSAAHAGKLEAQLGEHRNLALRAISAAEDNRAGLRDQQRRLSLVLGEIRSFLARGTDGEAIAARLEDHQAHLLDPLYVAFEDRFRGSRADIKQRQSVYLDILRQAGAGAPGRPIVDVGSGRGELLELLGEHGLAARGVDLNEAMVSLCAGAGLDCTQDDAVAYVQRAEPGSLGAVTGFHIIEHLPFEAMVALFDASLHALAPGGMVVFETPNPANLLVASRWFYLDPTHRNPLPGEMVAMIAEARGFIDVSIRLLHPMERRFEAQDRVLAGQLDELFFGPQDYAIIARKAK